MELVLTLGLPGSGKTTYAKEQLVKQPNRYKLVSKDELRLMLDDGQFSKVNEALIEQVELQIAETALLSKKSVIVHDTGFDPDHQERYRKLAKKHGIAFRVKDFTHVPIEKCIERDLKRLHSVGEEVIRNMHAKYLAQQIPVPQYIEGVKQAVICDLDGTLALFKHHRGPYDASTCEKDDLCPVVSSILVKYRQEDGKVILVSGRQEKDRKPTERWLKAHGITYDALYMRQTKDQREDSIIKRELFERYVQGRYNIDFVLDDRASVCKMWREQLGLKVLQVASGDY